MGWRLMPTVWYPPNLQLNVESLCVQDMAGNRLLRCVDGKTVDVEPLYATTTVPSPGCVPLVPEDASWSRLAQANA